MIAFWVVAGVLVAVALAFVLPPLLGMGHRQTADAEEINRSVYQQKRRELEQDRAGGLLSEASYQSARDDLDRDLLASTSALTHNHQPAHPRSRSQRLAIAVTLVLPVVAILLYTQLTNGLAGLQEQPARAADSTSKPSVKDMVARLDAHLKDHPDDLQGWAMLGRSYAALERYQQAAQAYGHAHVLSQASGQGLSADRRVDLTVAYAEALAYANDGRFSDQAERLVQQALAHRPDHQKALWLAGWAAFQQQSYQRAVADWRRLRKQVPAANKQVASALDKQIALAQRRAPAAGSPPAAGASSQAVDGNGAGSIAGQAADKPASIRVAVDLDPALADQVNARDALFIYAQAAGGPRVPLSITRHRAGELPLRVTLDDSKSMLPQHKLSGAARVNIKARISKSGNAVPQSGDLLGVTRAVSPQKAPMVSITIDDKIP